MPSMTTAKQVIVRPFVESEWQIYRDTRLAALKDSPDAFGSTYEVTSRLTDPEWQARLRDVDATSSLPLAAFVDDNVAGLAWPRIEAEERSDAYLYQMWVNPAFRGNGVGRRLLDVAMAWAKDNGARQMILEVTCGDRPARRLYERAGFVAFGPTEPLREGSDIEVQNMICRL